MNYLVYILGGLGVLAIVLFPKLAGLIGDAKTKKNLVQNEKDDVQLKEDVKKVDVNVVAVDKEIVKIDQKLEDLKDQKVTSEDISNFLTSMEDKGNK